MNDHGPRPSLGGQLSLFEDEPLYALDTDRTPLPSEDGEELFDEGTDAEVGDPDEDAANDDAQEWSAPREWALSW